MGQSILIVDDEKDITDALKTGLEGRGYNVDTYNDPTVALQNFKAGKYDIVILDIRMPKMNGFELYRELRKIDQKVSVSFFTAFDVYREEFEKMFPDVKAAGFLKKPMTIAQLVGHLKQLEA